MNIPETFHFDKDGEVVRSGFPFRFKEYFGTILILLIGFLGFGLGRLSKSGGEGVVLNYNPSLAAPAVAGKSSSANSGNFTNSITVYASAKGTKYYFLNCKSTISEKNKITFASSREAEAAGYSLSSTCLPR